MQGQIDNLKKVAAKTIDWHRDDILYFKDEPIYLTKDIVELHTA